MILNRFPCLEHLQPFNIFNLRDFLKSSTRSVCRDTFKNHFRDLSSSSQGSHQSFFFCQEFFPRCLQEMSTISDIIEEISVKIFLKKILKKHLMKVLSVNSQVTLDKLNEFLGSCRSLGGFS